MNEPENTSDAMMLTGAGRYEEQSEEILITDGGTLSTLTDDMIFKEIVPAMEACGNPFREDVEEAVLETRRMLQESWKRIIDHDELSDVISHALMSLGCYGEASCYVARQTEKKHAKSAELNTLMAQMDEIVSGSAEEVSIKRENANINGETPMGVMLRLGSESAKKLYLSRYISKRFASAHTEGDIHIHDLDFYSQTTTCTQIDLLKLFLQDTACFVSRSRLSAMRHWRALRFSPIRTISTAVKAFLTLIMQWLRAWQNPSEGTSSKAIRTASVC